MLACKSRYVQLLSGAEEQKEEGNELFKSKKYEDALLKYSITISMMKQVM